MHWAAWTIVPRCSTAKQHVTSVVDSDSKAPLCAVQVTGVLANGLGSSQKIEIATAVLWTADETCHGGEEAGADANKTVTACNWLRARHAAARVPWDASEEHQNQHHYDR
jgi:hypothetical protein